MTGKYAIARRYRDNGFASLKTKLRLYDNCVITILFDLSSKVPIVQRFRNGIVHLEFSSASSRNIFSGSIDRLTIDNVYSHRLFES